MAADVAPQLRLGAPGRFWGTVRFKLTLLATSVVAAVLVLSGFELIAVQRALLINGIDETLMQRGDNLQAVIESGPLDQPLTSQGDPDDSFLQLLGPDGEVVAASANVAGLPPAHAPAARGSPDLFETSSGFPLSDDDEYRLLVRSSATVPGVGTVVVAENLDDVQDAVSTLATSLMVSIPVVIVLLAVLLAWLTGRVLRPVESIRAEVANIHGGGLHRRVPVPDAQDEVARLARTMNEMLDRLQRATERQKQFVADASHELRGPLTRIRSNLEVALDYPDTVGPDELHAGLLADTADLQKLVEDLLYLARHEADATGMSTAPVDLDDLVLAEARRLRERGSVRIDVSAVCAARTLGDAGQLARAIRNLASNAERHAATTVGFEVREVDGHAELVVADDGDGVPVAHQVAVFERFTRLDAARTRDAGGSGLGLAIVNDIVHRHAGTIRIASANGGGARFVMTLPRAD